MIQKIITEVRNIDKKPFKLMINIFKVAMLLAIFSTYILSLYIFNPVSNLAFQFGIQLFKCSITCVSISIICALAVNKLMYKQI